MALRREEAFDPARPVVVRRPFQAAGRHWPVGARFPWHQLAVSRRRVAQMFNAGRLRHEVGAPASPTVSPPHPPAEETPAPSDELDAIDSMVELREVAEQEGAPRRLSKDDQRRAIRENRA